MKKAIPSMRLGILFYAILLLSGMPARASGNYSVAAYDQNGAFIRFDNYSLADDSSGVSISADGGMTVSGPLTIASLSFTVDSHVPSQDDFGYLHIASLDGSGSLHVLGDASFQTHYAGGTTYSYVAAIGDIDLTVDGYASFDDAGSFANDKYSFEFLNNTINLNGGGSLVGDGFGNSGLFLDHSTLNLGAGKTFTTDLPSLITFANGSTLNNAGTMIWHGLSFKGSEGVIHNTGIIETQSANTIEVEIPAGIALNNDGVVKIGNMHFAIDGSSDSAGTFEIGGGSLELGGATTLKNGAKIEFVPDTPDTQPGRIALGSGATLTVNTGAEITGLTFYDNANDGTNTITNAGTITLGASIAAFHFYAGALNNSGTFVVTRNTDMNATITNSGLFEVGDATAPDDVTSITATFYTKSFTNSGEIRLLDRGSIALGKDSTQNAGAYFSRAVGAIGQVYFTGGAHTFNASVYFDTPVSIAGDATELTGSGSLHFAQPLTWTSGTLSGSGVVYMEAGGVVGGGGVMVLDDKTLDLAAGQTTALKTVTLNNAAEIDNHGLATLAGDMNHSGEATADIRNFGEMDVTDYSNIRSGVAFENHGTLVLNDRFLNIESGPWTNEGTITGKGLMIASGGTVNAGTISPGQSLGTLTFRNGLRLEAASHLVFQLAGTDAETQFDRIRVESGALSLDGDIAVSLLGGFEATIASTDSFDILAGNNVTGIFDNGDQVSVTVEGIGVVGVMDIVYGSDRVTLTNFQAVPEPSTLTLGLAGVCFLGFACVFRRIRRKES